MSDSFSIRTQMNTLPVASQHEAEARLWRLHCVLVDTYASGLRDDSRLAYQFATNANKCPYVDVESVAHEMACADVIHSSTDYWKQSRTASRQHAASLVKEHGISWRNAWDVTRNVHMNVIKYNAMLAAQLVLPSMNTTPSAANCGPVGANSSA